MSPHYTSFIVLIIPSRMKNFINNRYRMISPTMFILYLFVCQRCVATSQQLSFTPRPKKPPNTSIPYQQRCLFICYGWLFVSFVFVIIHFDNRRHFQYRKVTGNFDAAFMPSIDRGMIILHIQPSPQSSKSTHHGCLYCSSLNRWH